MTITELKSLLDATGYPVAYSHFRESVSPPFIVYREVGSENLGADNKVYHDVKDFDIELYTTIKDLTSENVIEQILKDNELPYDTTEVYIEDERLFQKTYEVRLI